MPHTPPQPSIERITPFSGHPLVVGVEPALPELVPLTAASLAVATGAPLLVFAYADVMRLVVDEYPDGSVRHEPLEPDALDDTWQTVERELRERLGALLADQPVAWDFRYLAGRPDRALTHLARAVDAAAIIVGTRAPGVGAHVREWMEGSVAMHLAHHQHRPVVTVPLSVADWKDGASAWDR